MPRAIPNMLSSASRAGRLRALYVLREAARLGNADAESLLTTGAPAILEALDAPVVRMSCASAFLALRSAPLAALSVLDAATSLVALKVAGSLTTDSTLPSVVPSHGWPLCVGRCAALEAIAVPPSGTTLVEDPSEVATAWLKARSVIERLLPDECELMRDAVDLCAGLDGPHGEIRAFSNPDIPGLIVIGIRNAPVLLAEQVVHESTHIRLALRVEADETLSRMLEEMPACASPFTGSIRPAERVLHGVVSYGRVLRMWEALQRYPLDPAWFEDANDHARIIARRVREVGERIARGWSSLVAAATTPERLHLARVYADLVGGSPIQGIGEENQGRESLLARLKPNARAEVILATAGHKASRITVRVHDESVVEALLSSGIAACFGRTAHRPRTTPQLAGFSNLFNGDVCSILDAGQGYEALLYVASNGEKVREVFEHDQDDAAGSLFGIPPCCQTFFRRSWSRARIEGGDLFAMLLAKAVSENGQIHIPWACNAAAMYFGGGLCWHFPCALECRATVAVVEARLRALGALDPTLSSQLVAAQRRGFLWSPSRGYGLVPQGPLDSVQVGAIQWSGVVPDIPPEKTVQSWLGEHSAEGWRLVIPIEVGEVRR
jgi:hypothetical protein